MEKIKKREKSTDKALFYTVNFIINEDYFTFLWKKSVVNVRKSFAQKLSCLLQEKSSEILGADQRSLKILFSEYFFSSLTSFPSKVQNPLPPFSPLNIVTHLRMQDKFWWRYEIWVKFQPITTMHQCMVTRELFISVGSGRLFCIKSYVFSWSYKEAYNLHICIILSHDLYWFVWTNKLG